MKLPFPLLWLALVGMWLMLTRTITVGQTVLAMLIALAAVIGLRSLQPSRKRAQRPMAALRLAAVVTIDIIRSNLEVAALVLHPNRRKGNAAFLDIPLDLRDPGGLAVLACIITSTPGTSWAGYDSRGGVLTMHILDSVDDEASIRVIKNRYERLLLEIFE
jgi:multicomponent K+:H+ antiporter subunit E